LNVLPIRGSYSGVYLILIFPAGKIGGLKSWEVGTKKILCSVLRKSFFFFLNLNSLWYAGLNEFNKLPLNVKSSDNLNYFKEQVKEHLKLKYPI
jgi:hypothetical protein